MQLEERTPRSTSLPQLPCSVTVKTSRRNNGSFTKFRAGEWVFRRRNPGKVPIQALGLNLSVKLARQPELRNHGVIHILSTATLPLSVYLDENLIFAFTLETLATQSWTNFSKGDRLKLILIHQTAVILEIVTSTKFTLGLQIRRNCGAIVCLCNLGYFCKREMLIHLFALLFDH